MLVSRNSRRDIRRRFRTKRKRPRSCCCRLSGPSRLSSRSLTALEGLGSGRNCRQHFSAPDFLHCRADGAGPQPGPHQRRALEENMLRSSGLFSTNGGPSHLLDSNRIPRGRDLAKQLAPRSGGIRHSRVLVWLLFASVVCYCSRGEHDSLRAKQRAASLAAADPRRAEPYTDREARPRGPPPGERQSYAAGG